MSYRSATLKAFGAVVTLIFCLTGLASAQGRAEGTITGIVTDATKAVLPGVTVTATNPQTGFTREAITDEQGAFLLPLLPPASYDVVATLTGFGTFRRTVTVSVGAEQRLPIALSVATLQEAITVTGEAPLVETTKTEQGTQLNQTEVQNLPASSRSYLAFAALAPGVVAEGASGFSTSGNRNGQNNFNLDGMTNKNLNSGGDMGRISPESVQEFQIVTQSYPAEYGGAAGGVTNAISKSGTNQVSGYGFWFMRHDAFDAPPFNTRPGADGVVEAFPVAEANFARRHVAGFTVGGPIKRDRAFFFGVLDRTSNAGRALRTTLPGTLETVRQIAIPDLPDNDSNAAAEFNDTETTTSVKVDLNLSQQNTLSFTGGTFRSFEPGGSCSGRCSIYGSSEGRDYTNRLGGSLNTILSERTLNTFRGSFNRSDSRSAWPQRGGFENLDNWAAGFIILGNTGGTFGVGELGQLPHDHDWETKIEFQDSMTLYRDKHTLKLGASYLFADVMQYSFYYGLGEWRFSGIEAFRAGRPSGLVQSFGAAAANLKVHSYSGFIQDEWQPRSNLTFNLGVRYDLNRLPTDLSQIELPEPAFNQRTGRHDITHVSNSYMTGFNNDTNNVQPRLGFSWAINDKTVVRGGGGMFFGGAHYGEIAQGMGQSIDGYERYDFPSVEAAEIWAGLHDPTSPIYNGGRMRLSQAYRDRFLAGRRPFSMFDHPADMKMPESIQVSIGLERQLLPGLSLSGNFLWNKGDFEYRPMNINSPAPLFFPAGSTLPSGVVTPFDVNYRSENGLRPDPQRANVYSYQMLSRTRYKGGSVGLTARRGSFTVRGAYTYNDTWDEGEGISTRILPQDSDCVRCEFAQSHLSITHSFRGSAVYQVPRSWPIWAREWQLSSIVDMKSGSPRRVVASFDFNNDNVITDRPFGVPRNALWSDAFYKVDLRLARFFPIRGRVRAELLFEMFNVFNRANFTGYDGNLYRFQNGRYVPYDDFAAYAASPLLNEGYYQGRDRITTDEIGLDHRVRRSGVGTARQGQLAIRFHF